MDMPPATTGMSGLSPSTVPPANLLSAINIGARAKGAAPVRYVQNLGLSDRRKQLETLRLLLLGIRNIPTDAGPGLRIKGNTLVVKLATGDYQALIEGFRLASDHHGSVDALTALCISNVPTHGSVMERLRCALSWVGNRLIGRDASHTRAERLQLDINKLRESVEVRQHSLTFVKSDLHRVMPYFDTACFRNKRASDLEGLYLPGLPLHECNFRSADLSGENLSGCSLPCEMTNADLRHTRMFGVTFGKLSRFHQERIGHYYAPSRYENFEERRGKVYPDFSGVQLQGAKLTMPSPFEDTLGDMAAILDRGYNHLNNTGSGSLLESIHSIDDLALKRTLMEENIALLMNKTSAQDRAAISAPLTDVLFNHDYLDPASADALPSIRRVVNELVEHHFATGHEQLLQVELTRHIDPRLFLEEHLSRAQTLVDICCAEGQSKPGDAPAAFCQQLIQACAQGNPPDLHDRALQLQQAIYRLPANIDVVNALSNVLGYDGRDSVELGGIAVFTGDDGHSAAMSGNYYQTFIQKSATGENIVENPEHEILLLKGLDEVASSSLSRHIENIPYLHQFLQPSLRDINFSAMLGLDFPDDYKKLFKEASQSGTHRGEKLISPEHKLRLRVLAEPYLEEPVASASGRHMNVTDAYVIKVLASAPVPCNSKLEQGYYLLCLSAVFTKYSSSAQFGTELDSPESLRELAAGLLNAARKRLPQGPMTNRTFTDLQDRLLGNSNAFSCTAVAHRKMRELLRQLCQIDTALKRIYDASTPATWR
jgi:uncharacterized protein YjbI with pentapeptide repeats